jgi:flagellar motor switch protein FliN/FliY
MTIPMPVATPTKPIADPARILRLEVPVVVRVGERQMTMGEVLALVPGSIIELTKRAEDELDLLVNNKQIGSGTAVKVGENFGLRVTYIGDARERIKAMGEQEGDEAGAI